MKKFTMDCHELRIYEEVLSATNREDAELEALVKAKEAFDYLDFDITESRGDCDNCDTGLGLTVDEYCPTCEESGLNKI